MHVTEHTIPGENLNILRSMSGMGTLSIEKFLSEHGRLSEHVLEL